MSQQQAYGEHRYAELSCFSNFTFLKGASSPEELIEQACQLGYGALAITDECSVAGVKILDTIEELSDAAKEMMGKTLVTHQTGPEGREVKRLYVEESSNIDKEFYLSCLVDRASSKIAFISSDQGGMDIEK